jgi:Transposase DDE domain group 1
VKRTYPKILRNRKARIERRIKPRNWTNQKQPMLGAKNIEYEMAEKSQAESCGGIGAIHLMVQRLGLAKEIDQNLKLLKVHLPYHESDHVLNVAYNVMVGGQRMEDMERLRQDEVYLNGLGAQRTPDPTTAGDFCRRFTKEDVLTLQDCINRTRAKVWAKQPKGFLEEAVLDVDGTIASTQGECKGGMSMSYKGIWGYGPLVVSLANTKEVLYTVNRPGNVASHQDSAEWIDRAVKIVRPHAKKITLRGDTDFTHTAHLDRWTADGLRFVLGMDAHVKVVELAKKLKKADWKPLERLPKYEIKTEPRQKPHRVKEQIVQEKGYENIKLVGESVAEIEYQPQKCTRPYRLIVLRKNLSVKKGEKVLFDDIRFFFYLTNDPSLSVEKVVRLANGRCDQENVIEQLKNGVNAMRMPVSDLEGNGAYMVMATLAWNLKAWWSLLVPKRDRGMELLRMEFRRFLHSIILIPCQLVRTGRRIIYRVLSYNSWLADFFATFERIRGLPAP